MMREGTNDTLEFEYRKLAASEASLDQTLTKYRTFARNADKLLPAGSAPCP
jgi:hypothetical protein